MAKYPATYIQITNACNMRCAHCCYECKPHGEYMSVDTFRQAVSWHKGNHLNIGGGEPTLHPDIFDIVDIAVNTGHHVWMVINGKLGQKALKLAEMTDSIENFYCKLSRDRWHQPISEEVVEAFAQIGKIHKVKTPIVGGRWKRKGRNVCQNSNKPFVRPSGNVHQCGCMDAPCVGDVFNGFHPVDGKWECANGMKHTKPGRPTQNAVKY